MVREHCEAHGSQWSAIRSIAAKIGCGGEAARATGCGRPSGTAGSGPGPHGGARAHPRPGARGPRSAPGSPRTRSGADEVPRKASARLAQAELDRPSKRRSSSSTRTAPPTGSSRHPDRVGARGLPAAADRPVDPTARMRPRGATRASALPGGAATTGCAPRDRARARRDLRALTGRARDCGSSAARASRSPGAPWSGRCGPWGCGARCGASACAPPCPTRRRRARSTG
jgi:hypothetical protein